MTWTDWWKRPGEPGVFLILLAPLLPFFGRALGGPWAQAVTDVPSRLLMIGFGLLLGLWVWQRDPWLGVVVSWGVLTTLWAPTLDSFQSMLLLVLGGVGVSLVQAVSLAWRDVAARLLVVMTVIQVSLAVWQAVAHTDLIWMQPLDVVVGMEGNPAYLGMILAMIWPLAPLWLAPVFLGGLILSKSVVALGAAAVGMAWVHRHHWQVWLMGGTALLVLTVSLREAWGHSVGARWAVWSMAVQAETPFRALIGYGPGSWAFYVPQLQQVGQVLPKELFMQAHNEWLQVLFEYGVIGLLLLLGWLWSYRSQVTQARPINGSLVALALLSAAYFPFRYPTMALVALVVMGLATAHPEEAT